MIFDGTAILAAAVVAGAAVVACAAAVTGTAVVAGAAVVAAATVSDAADESSSSPHAAATTTRVSPASTPNIRLRMDSSTSGGQVGHRPHGLRTALASRVWLSRTERST